MASDPGSGSLATSQSPPSLCPHLALSLQLPHRSAHDVGLARGQAQCRIYGHVFGGPIAGHDVQFYLWQERPVSHPRGRGLGSSKRPGWVCWASQVRGFRGRGSSDGGGATTSSHQVPRSWSWSGGLGQGHGGLSCQLGSGAHGGGTTWASAGPTAPGGGSPSPASPPGPGSAETSLSGAVGRG